MLRRVTDVANITYWMRCQGDALEPVTATRFDNDLRTALEASLGGAMPDRSWWQAQLAVVSGGLGLRSAAATAPLAFLSSRTAARPMVEDLFRRMERNELGKTEDYMRQYDSRTSACMTAHTAEWGEGK